jgi:hypothetical protein
VNPLDALRVTVVLLADCCALFFDGLLSAIANHLRESTPDGSAQFLMGIAAGAVANPRDHSSCGSDPGLLDS